jgi:nucleotide-binding universal stress UspA family protein
VLNVAHPPAVGLPSLGSGLRTIIWRLARPLLALPGDPRNLNRALLAFDGSLEAKEALFVATYLAEQWKTALTVITLTNSTKVSSSVLDYARDYLELHEIQADFISANGTIDVFLKIIEERNIDLVLMGGYSVSPLEEVVIGSAVNFMLRETHCPLLICR